MSRKITKIVINILQKISDNERYLQNAWKQAVFEILGLHYIKFQIPTAYGLITIIIMVWQGTRSHSFFFVLLRLVIWKSIERWILRCIFWPQSEFDRCVRTAQNFRPTLKILMLGTVRQTDHVTHNKSGKLRAKNSSE